MKQGLNVCAVYCPMCYAKLDLSVGLAGTFETWQEFIDGKTVHCAECTTAFRAEPVVSRLDWEYIIREPSKD